MLQHYTCEPWRYFVNPAYAAGTAPYADSRGLVIGNNSEIQFDPVPLLSSGGGDGYSKTPARFIQIRAVFYDCGGAAGISGAVDPYVKTWKAGGPCVDWLNYVHAATVSPDFSEGTAAAADLLANNNFAADTDWHKSGSWTIAGGVASHDSTQPQSPIWQPITLTAGNWYSWVTKISGAAVDLAVRHPAAANGGLIYRLAEDFSDTWNLAGIMQAETTATGPFAIVAGGASVIDDTYIRQVYPFIYTEFYDAATYGTGFGVSIGCADNLSGTYYDLQYQRILEN